MQIARRITIILLSIVAVLLFLVVAVSLVITNTDWGRERVRNVAMNQLGNAIEGEITLGKLEGDLLRELRLIDVSIVDTEGRPFVHADTLESGFSLLNLLRARIVLSDIRVVNGEIILDEPPGEDWNFVRIFMSDPDTAASESPWGQWIELQGIELVDSRIMMRAAWEPPPELQGAERDAAIREALAGETRANVVEVPGGFQNVMDFRELNALFSRALVAHPDTAAIPVDVERFSGIVQPFAPPAAIVHDLSGNIRIADDSLFVHNIDAVLPGSRLRGDGVYVMEHGELLMRLEGAPVALADLRWLYPPLPEEGGGRLDADIAMGGAATRIRVRDADLQVDESRLMGRIDLTLGDTLRLDDTDLRFSDLDTRLIQGLAPALQLPRHGRLTGYARADGTQAAMDVDVDVAFAELGGGTSRVTARGDIGTGEQVRTSGLTIQVEPLQADLVRAFAPDVPLRGTIVGDARLSGAVGGLMQLRSDLSLRDPRTGESRLAAAGTIDMRNELRLAGMMLRLDPLRMDLLREQLPQIPPQSALTGSIRLDGAPAQAMSVSGSLALADPGSGVSRVSIDGHAAYADAVRFSDLRLNLDPLQLDLIRPYADEVPPGGTVSGPIRIDGPLAGRLQLDAALTVTDPATGVSSITAGGGVELEPTLALHDFDVLMDPLQVALVRRYAPDFDLGGILTGHVRVDGAPQQQVAFAADLAHEQAGERSALTGGGRIATAGEGHVDVNLQLHPLSLNTVGRLAPSSGLHGRAAGQLRASGSLQDLRLDADLTLNDTSRVDATGRIDRSGADLEYAFDATVERLDVAAVSTNAPASTDLTGFIRADGRGTDPATMQASVLADLQGSAVDGRAADAVRIDASLGDGLLALDSLLVELPSAWARASGTFGLTDARSGTLHFDAAVDSLEAFTGFVAGTDTTQVVLRPRAESAVRRHAEEQRRAAREDADVLYLATGRLHEPEEPDAVGIDPIPRDTLAGRAELQGTISGNISRFDARGDATVSDFVYSGNYLGSGDVSFDIRNAPSDEVEARLNASLERVLAGGFAFESAEIEGEYDGGRYGDGAIRIDIEQDDAVDIRADAAFALALERNEVRLQGMDVRLDTVRWTSDGLATIDWSGRGVRVHDLRLNSSHGGRVFVDGDLPVEGPADLVVNIEDLEIGHVYALLQGEEGTSGRLFLDGRLEGPLAEPRMEGDGRLVNARIEDEDLPDIFLELGYADRELQVDALLVDQQQELATIQGMIPIDLSLAGAEQRLVDRPMQLDVRAQRLPLDALPAFTDQVEAVDGSITIDLAITGRVNEPALEGGVALSIEQMEIVPLGTRYERIVGNMRSEGGVLYVDSLVAWSGGPLRISGEVGLASLTEPEFDLDVVARETWVIDTDDAQLQVDADLDVTGPLNGLTVSGDVETRRGVIYVPELSEFGSTDVVNLDDTAIFERVDTLLQAQRTRVAGQSELMANLEIDIGITIDRDVWLRSSEANVEIYTPPEIGPLFVRMTGLQDLPTIEGTINTDRGEYEYASRRFTLTRGAVTFMGTEELNAIFQLAAEHEVQVPGREPFNIRIVISGTLQDPQLVLESSAQPPISQSDLLSFLVFGRDASSLLSTSGSGLSGQGTAGGGLVGNVAGIATQQYAAFALEAMVSRVESDLARDLGLDVFRITPADLPAELFTGSYLDVLRGTEVELGSYIVPRFFVAAQLRPTFAYPGLTAEYRTRNGYEWSASWQPRYLPQFPTLREREAARANVFGSYLFREWRF